MATSYNRAGVTRRLVEIARQVLAADGVTVSYGWPGDDVTDSTLWFAPPEGRATPESLGYGQTLTTDEFFIPATLVVTPFLTAEDAAEGAEAVFRTLDDTLRGLKRLQDTTATIGDGTAADYRGVRSVRVGEVIGPGWAYSQANSNGPLAGIVAFTLDCTSDLTTRST